MIIEEIFKSVLENKEKTAFSYMNQSLSYERLWKESDILSEWIRKNVHNNNPILVYGHKDEYIIISFLACVKSGHAYCPIDISLSMDRIQDIYNQTKSPFILNTTDSIFDFPIKSYSPREIIEKNIINHLSYDSVEFYEKNKRYFLKHNETFYIIFTSGSTGVPKGVCVSTQNLSNFVNWSRKFVESCHSTEGRNFLNQAPFSFDLSVMDLYTSLVTGGNLCCVDKKMQMNVSELVKNIAEYKLNYWVSTPSFAELCLSEKCFNSSKFGELKLFFFCGERLSKKIAEKIKCRFPKSTIINAYGPTESTVAVTSMEIDEAIIQNNEILPIGVEKEGTIIKIINEEGKEVTGQEPGEIVIYGDTVATGYFNDLEQTKKVFGKDQQGLVYYKTGDRGYRVNNILYCTGRIDMQIKFHGYRIELGDIEHNLEKINEVNEAVVIPYYKEDKIKYLVGIISSNCLENNYETRKMIKEKLRELLPEYMIPKKMIINEELPMNQNGKIDRKKLRELFL